MIDWSCNKTLQMISILQLLNDWWCGWSRQIELLKAFVAQLDSTNIKSLAEYHSSIIMIAEACYCDTKYSILFNFSIINSVIWTSSILPLTCLCFTFGFLVIDMFSDTNQVHNFIKAHTLRNERAFDLFKPFSNFVSESPCPIACWVVAYFRIRLVG